MDKPVTFVVGRDPSGGKGGHASYVRAHARAAIRVGLEPHFFTPGDDDSVVETDFGIIHRVRSSPLRIKRLDPSVGIRKSLIFWHAPLLAAAVERFLLPRPGPHLIHGFATWSCAGTMASQRLRRKGVKSLTISSLYTTAEHEVRGKIHGINSTHGYLQRIRYRAEQSWIKHIVGHYERKGYTEPDLVLVNYESVRKMFFEQFGDGAEVRIVPYSSESAFLREETQEASAIPASLAALRPVDAPLIVSVSRHDPRKGVDLLLRALAELRDSGAQFRACLVGGGHLLDAHRRLAEQLRLGDRVAIEGWVPDPRPYLREANVYVLPSLQEGSGSVSLIEALQAGAAVVASNIDGIPEDVVDGKSALLVEPGNIAALRKALSRVVTDSDLRHRLARQSRETFIAKFRPESFVNALREIYAGLGFEGKP